MAEQAEPKAIDKTDLPISFQRHVRVANIPIDGLDIRLQLQETEIEQLAIAVNAEKIANIDFAVHLKPAGKDRITVTGGITADLTHACIVTGDPIVQQLREEIDTRFWPEKQVQKWLEAANDPGQQDSDRALEDEPEPYSDDEIAIGQFLYEEFVSAVDLYPRKAGAEFDWQKSEFNVQTEEETSSQNPFSVLAPLKDKETKDKSS